MSSRPLGVGVIGCDHRHIFGMLQGMLDVGAVGRGWWTDGEPPMLDGFRKRFPALPRVADPRALLDDPAIDLVLIATVPCDRAQWADRGDGRRQGRDGRQAGLHDAGRPGARARGGGAAPAASGR